MQWTLYCNTLARSFTAVLPTADSNRIPAIQLLVLHITIPLDTALCSQNYTFFLHRNTFTAATDTNIWNVSSEPKET